MYLRTRKQLFYAYELTSAVKHVRLTTEKYAGSFSDVAYYPVYIVCVVSGYQVRKKFKKRLLTVYELKKGNKIKLKFSLDHD
jgi:hypothetical protein